MSEKKKRVRVSGWVWAKPQRWRKKWRIRWIDERGVRRQATFVLKRTAELALRNRHIEVEAKRELMRAANPLKPEEARG